MTVPARRLELDGELTIVAAAEQQARVRGFLAESPAPAELDLSGVTELDTAGLQILLAARREAEQRGTTLTFHDPSGPVRSVFETAHLSAELD
ncbi:STAS domain-containing protein [Dactylosporangium sp. NPDC049742]|uniref:STAS domain-containing protein n=1 Tax=Dactylosporangium sp. NPDC049742 TaxID=3154737 RepID=UPI00342BA504